MELALCIALTGCTGCDGRDSKQASTRSRGTAAEKATADEERVPLLVYKAHQSAPGRAQDRTYLVLHEDGSFTLSRTRAEGRAASGVRVGEFAGHLSQEMFESLQRYKARVASLPWPVQDAEHAQADPRLSQRIRRRSEARTESLYVGQGHGGRVHEGVFKSDAWRDLLSDVQRLAHTLDEKPLEALELRFARSGPNISLTLFALSDKPISLATRRAKVSVTRWSKRETIVEEKQLELETLLPEGTVIEQGWLTLHPDAQLSLRAIAMRGPRYGEQVLVELRTSQYEFALIERR